MDDVNPISEGVHTATATARVNVRRNEEIGVRSRWKKGHTSAGTAQMYVEGSPCKAEDSWWHMNWSGNQADNTLPMSEGIHTITSTAHAHDEECGEIDKKSWWRRSWSRRQTNDAMEGISVSSSREHQSPDLHPRRLPRGDNRFAPNKKDKQNPRVYICDNDKCRRRCEFWKNSVQFDGQYVDFEATRGYSPTALKQAYLKGIVDVTWYCTVCHQRPWETLPQTRSRLHIIDDERVARTSWLISSGFNAGNAGKRPRR